MGSEMCIRDRLNVGDTVQLNLPSAEPDSSRRPLDPVFSGKYLVTAIKNSLKRNKYIMVVELSRDSVPIPLTHGADNTSSGRLPEVITI